MKKLTLVLVGALVLGGTFFAVDVNAQTVGDLQTQLHALMAQVQALQAQLQQTTGAPVSPSPIFSPAPAASCITVSSNLSRNNRGNEMTALQQVLRQIGAYNGPVTGFFGPLTQSAVSAFQAENGLSATGSVDAQTAAAINRLSCAAGSPGTPITNPSSSEANTINVVTHVGGRVSSQSENGSCVSNLVTPAGNNNTAGCVRTLTNQPAGSYSLQWYGGYPSGADTTKQPTVKYSPQVLTGGGVLTFYVSFEAVPSQSLTSITVTSPSTGTTWYIGDILSVQWSGSVPGVDTLDINLWPEEGGKTSLYTIASGIPASSSKYSWTIPFGALNNYGGTGHNFYVQLVGKAFEVKSGKFIINPKEQPSPSMTISWSGGSGKVQVGVVDGRFEQNGTILGWITTNGITSGSLTWDGKTVSDLIGNTKWSVSSLSQGPFRILGVTAGPTGNFCAGTGGDCKYVLSNSFSISYAPSVIQLPAFPTVTSSPSITILSPNGGERFVPGGKITVTWKKIGIPDTTNANKYYFVYLKDSPRQILGTQNYGITYIPLFFRSSTLGYPSFTVDVPEGASGLSYLEIDYTDESGVPIASDTNDAPFTIVSSTSTQPSIAITSPNGGGSYKIGDVVTVIWNASNVPSNATVSLQLSYNLNGSTFEDVITASPLSPDYKVGYLWTIPSKYAQSGMNPSSFRMRAILNYENGHVEDYSDAPFTITSVATQTGTVNVVTRHGGRVISASENGNCVSNVSGPTGNNTAGCVRILTNQPAGTSSLQWYGGYPFVSGYDPNRAPTITPAQTLAAGGSVTFYLDFEYVPPPVTKTYTTIDRPAYTAPYATAPICGDAASMDKFCKDNGYEGGELGTAYSGGSCFKWTGAWALDSSTLYSAKCYRTAVGAGGAPILTASFVEAMQGRLSEIAQKLQAILEQIR